MRKFEFWTVAYRQRQNQGTLLDDLQTPFSLVKNTWRYWAADPHLVEYDGTTYLFAELYDRVLRRGVIGYCELSGNGATAWRVALRAPYHLSYPHILRRDDTFYMIPESYLANEISVFRAMHFPDRWEKAAVLRKDFCAVDSTVFSDRGQSYLMTLQFQEDTERLLLFPFKDGALCGQGLVVAINDCNVRPAGHFFRWNGKRIRPGQDCSSSYGCALNFYEVTEVSSEAFSETLYKKIQPSDIRSNLKKKPEGIHTYNMSASYEVIDLKGYEADWLFYIMRPVWWLWRRIKRLFKKQ